MRFVQIKTAAMSGMAALAMSTSSSTMRSQNFSALCQARSLEAPRAVAERGGDIEGIEFWERNADLLEAARRELGPKREYVYSPSIHECLVPEVIQALENNHDSARALAELVKPTHVKGVFALRLLRNEFLVDLIDELEYLRKSGIPLRRPNGMNRHGCILSHLGFQEGLLTTVLAPVLRQLGLALYPKALRTEDLIGDIYGFSIRYEAIPGGDTHLREHADGSALTLNLCLGSKQSFEGGDLLFRGVRFHDEDAYTQTQQSIAHQPGVALIHLGQHLHAAATLRSGVRENLVLWMSGKHGYVRIAPYADEISNEIGTVFY